MRHRPTRFVCLTLLCVAPLCSSAHGFAQGVAASGMAQGEAEIKLRSDVKLAIQGTRSTTSERLAQLTDVLTDQLPALRKCYRVLIAKHATNVGLLAIRITLDENTDPVGLEFKEAGGIGPELKTCVSAVLGKAAYAKVGRPAAAIATLAFDNSRAKGQAEMTERMQVSDAFEVREGASGGFEGAWSSADGHVGFVVAGKGSKEAVSVVLRTLRNFYAGFADCRRRAQKGGLSSEGNLELDLQLQAAGVARAKVTGSTVAQERASACVEHAVKKLHFADVPAGQHFALRVHLGP